MDSNYEAQRELTKQRLAARREDGRVGRLLREGQPKPGRGLRGFLMQFWKRSGQRREKKATEAAQSAELAVAGKGKGPS
jgi:hypothetical protein